MRRIARQLAKADLSRLRFRTRIHFLHIGKNAGTQIRHIASQINARSGKYTFVTHRHRTRLSDLPEGAQYFFSIRDPISRFQSGFYSRKRKGRPRVLLEWSPGERVTFTQFEHANDLAEALFEPSRRGRDAYSAVQSILHLAMHQHSWFGREGHFLATQPPLHIIRQEKFADDMADFMDVLGLDRGMASISDVAAHRNDYSEVPELSEKAVRNLSVWYAADIEFYRLCIDHLEQKKRRVDRG